jgi:hypothetical protein
MVRIAKLLKDDSNLNEYNEVREIVSKQLAEHLKGGYIEELIKTINVPYHKPKVMEKVVVGKALIGSGHDKVKCQHCKGKGYNRKQMCNHCEGSGWLDWIDKGFNFISSLFGSKKEQPKAGPKPASNQSEYNGYKPKQQEANDPDFLIHGARKAELLAVLGLSSNATKDQVIKAYKKLALKYHPDKGGDPADFRRVNEAKTALVGGELKKNGVGTKNEVWNGSASRTSGGLTKKDLMKNSKGKVVSIRQFEAGQRAYQNIAQYTIPKKSGRKARKN